MAAVLIAGADDELARDTARLLTRAGHTVSVSADPEPAVLDVLVVGIGSEPFEDEVSGLARVLQAFLPALERSAAPVVVVVARDAEAEAAATLVTVQYARTFPRLRINAAAPDAEIVARTALIGPDGPSGGYFDV
ncbi:hypothetical protein PV646_39350 [Streptomyces sp. ID05-26A]|nr:hypothetical protein [Streptomyces sp. ID05-26A]